MTAPHPADCSGCELCVHGPAPCSRCGTNTEDLALVDGDALCPNCRPSSPQAEVQETAQELREMAESLRRTDEELQADADLLERAADLLRSLCPGTHRGERRGTVSDRRFETPQEYHDRIGAEKSNERVKSWELPICTGCGGVIGLRGLDAGCSCDVDFAKTGKSVEVVPADSPAVLRAALDSPPVEETVLFRGVGDRGSRMAVVLEPPSENEEWVRSGLADYRDAGTYDNVRIQVQRVLTSPWTDLPSEEGER